MHFLFKNSMNPCDFMNEKSWGNRGETITKREKEEEHGNHKNGDNS